MKQPENTIDSDQTDGLYQVYIMENPSANWPYGDDVNLATATTKQAAWRKAVRRLERLLKEAKKKAGME